MAIVDDFTAIARGLKALEPEPQYDFSCVVCGCQCDTAPPLPLRAVCPAHCEDHDYVYEPYTGRVCLHCGAPAPFDYGEIDD